MNNLRRDRKAKILATLGPASDDEATILSLFKAGADVFRLNFSHGGQEDHQKRLQIIRRIEQKFDRPIGVLVDLQGPKIRIGKFENGLIMLAVGDHFRLDLERDKPGEQTRVSLAYPEIFAALTDHTDVLLDDGRIRLRVLKHGVDFAETTVITGGLLSDKKGVNVPGAILPLSALTAKDREDLDFALEQDVDWIALSFVQRPEDLQEIKEIVGNRASIIAKIEKPAAVEVLPEIVTEADAVMVARGDLGVELPAEQVPPLQKQIVRQCREAGKPVIVATQMLESMIKAPTPTRAEASDVATAIYDGADAVMLSAESAVGQFPVEAVRMMDNIIQAVEGDSSYSVMLDSTHTTAKPNAPDAICSSMRRAATMLRAAATVSYTSSGYSSLRAARERPHTPILSLTVRQATARRMTLVWGVHSIHEKKDIESLDEMIAHATEVVRDYRFGKAGEHIAIVAGIPFGNSGTTNLLHIAQL